MERTFFYVKKIFPQRFFSAFAPAYHFLLTFLAAIWFRFPSHKITVIGVTGTKGKTTVVHLIHEILQTSGAAVASVSSARFRIGDQERPNDLKMTMPGRFFLQRFLRRALKAGKGKLLRSLADLR